MWKSTQAAEKQNSTLREECGCPCPRGDLNHLRKGSSLVGRQVKDLALSLLCLQLQLWHRFSPWPGNF